MNAHARCLGTNERTCNFILGSSSKQAS